MRQEWYFGIPEPRSVRIASALIMLLDEKWTLQLRPFEEYNVSLYALSFFSSSNFETSPFFSTYVTQSWTLQSSKSP